MSKAFRLGDLLIENGLLTEEQLQSAIEQQKQTGVKLGQLLIQSELITEEDMLGILAKQLDLPVINLRHYPLDKTIIKRLPESYARRFRTLVLAEQDDGYLIGMSDPLNINAADEVQNILQRKVKTAVVSESDLLRTLDLVYRRTADISGFAEELHDELVTDIPMAELDAEDDSSLDAPVTKLLRSVFEDAIQVNASDIHIEPDEKLLRIRLRIDGVLHEQIINEKTIARPIALRVKLMAGLNIAEKRLPQDGRFHIKIRNHAIDVRLSTMPTQYGESIVMRLLDQTGGILDLTKLGMDQHFQKRFHRLLKKPHGVILVTGPTGSGKSTTLYAALKELNNEETKIITIEDPVEYRLPRINQVQINNKLDLTFARVLRTTLRQDPDIIMLGEMRDTETANIAMRAALTGHLVLSTLHTNDSASSAFRLVDMGIEGFLVAATLRGVLAQRLVRKVCDGCTAPYTPTDAEINWLKGSRNLNTDDFQFTHGTGCTYCNQSGFRGRLGIFELLELNSDMMDALRNNDPSDFSKQAEIALEGNFLVDDGLKLVKSGLTTISEVIRITGEI